MLGVHAWGDMIIRGGPKADHCPPDLVQDGCSCRYGSTLKTLSEYLSTFSTIVVCAWTTPELDSISAQIKFEGSTLEENMIKRGRGKANHCSYPDLEEACYWYETILATLSDQQSIFDTISVF